MRIAQLWLAPLMWIPTGMAPPGGVQDSKPAHAVHKAGTRLILLAWAGDMPYSVSCDK